LDQVLEDLHDFLRIHPLGCRWLSRGNTPHELANGKHAGGRNSRRADECQERLRGLWVGNRCKTILDDFYCHMGKGTLALLISRRGIASVQAPEQVAQLIDHRLRPPRCAFDQDF
jgi:hypothetical protein